MFSNTTCPYTAAMLAYLNAYQATIADNGLRVVAVLDDVTDTDALKPYALKYPAMLFVCTSDKGYSGQDFCYDCFPEKDGWYATPSLFAVDESFQTLCYVEGALRSNVRKLIGTLIQEDTSRVFGYRTEMNGTLTITSYTGSGAYVAIPSSIGGATVTGFGDGLFRDNAILRSVSVPGSVTSIGDGAFQNATALEQIALPDSLTSLGESVFAGCTSLFEFRCPSGLVSIGAGCFKDSGLAYFYANANLQAIAPDAFSGCTWLWQIHAPASSYAAEFFQDAGVRLYREQNELLYEINSLGELWITGYTGAPAALTIPAKLNGTPVRGIANGAFAGCSSLTSLTVSPGVEVIDVDAFFQCVRLQTVSLGNGVTALDRAFTGCAALTSLTLPDTLTTINNPIDGTDITALTIPDGVTDMYFCGADPLETVALREGIQTIPERCFAQSASLRAIMIPQSVTDIAKNAFDESDRLITVYTVKGSAAEAYFMEYCPTVAIKYLYGTSDAALVYELRDGAYTVTGYTGQPVELTIPEWADGYKVKAIAENAFRNLSTLTSVMMGDNVIDIGEGAFENCISLRAVSLSANARSLGDRAFAGCAALEEIILPAGVTALGHYAFQNCVSLARAGLPNGLASLPEGAFYGTACLTDMAVPDCVTAIGELCFSGSGLTRLTLEDTLTVIAEDAFSGCESLAGVTAPSESRAEAYFLARNIPVNPPDGSRYLYYAFYNGQCVITGYRNDPVELIIPETIGGYPVAVMGNDCLQGCATITRLVLPSTMRVLKSGSLHIQAEEIVLNEGLRVIDTQALNANTQLKQIALPDTVTEVGHNAFWYCEALKTARLSERLTRLEANSFRNAISLTEIVIPASVSAIDSGCFLDSGLTVISFMGYDVKIGEDRNSTPVFGRSDGQPCALAEARMYRCSTVEVYFLTHFPDVRLVYYDDPAATVTVNGITRCFTAIDEALAAAAGQTATLTLLANVSPSETIAVNGGALTLDLNGHTLTAAAGDAVVVGPGASFMVIENPRGGMICAEDENGCAIRAEGGDVKLCGGAYSAKGATLAATDTVGGMLGKGYAVMDGDTVLADTGSAQKILSGAFSVAVDWAWYEAKPALILPRDLGEIRKNAFSGSGCERVVMQEAVTAVGSRAFADCESLTLVEVRSTFVLFAKDAFENCDGALIFLVVKDSQPEKALAEMGMRVYSR